MQNIVRRQKLISARTIAKVGILSAIAYVLMFISVPLPIFPSFLKIDLSDIPAILGGMSLGPMAGLSIVIVKNFLQGITASATGGIGEFANIIIGGSYVITVCLFYRNWKNYKGVICGSLLGIVLMTITGCIMNYYVMLPLYSNFMPMDQIIQMGSIINPRINDLYSFVIWVIGPFNVVKGGIMTISILPLFKKMEKLISK